MSEANFSQEKGYAPDSLTSVVELCFLIKFIIVHRLDRPKNVYNVKVLSISLFSDNASS